MPIVRASEVVPRPASWVWRDRIQRGNLSVFDGDPGTNKTSLTCDLAARLTQGRSPYAPATVLMIQGEDSVSEMRARLLACRADLNRALIYDKTTGPGRPSRRRARRPASTSFSTSAPTPRSISSAWSRSWSRWTSASGCHALIGSSRAVSLGTSPGSLSFGGHR